jgi:hypothetical protein
VTANTPPVFELGSSRHSYDFRITTDDTLPERPDGNGPYWFTIRPTTCTVVLTQSGIADQVYMSGPRQLGDDYRGPDATFNGGGWDTDVEGHASFGTKSLDRFPTLPPLVRAAVNAARKAQS